MTKRTGSDPIGRGNGCVARRLAFGLLVLFYSPCARSEVFAFGIFGQNVQIELDHLGTASAVGSAGLDNLAFRPPSIFSAPLPTGSGARALGLAGAFVAVADDATAASWNPAGLLNLQRAEASVVARYSRELDQNLFPGDGLTVGRNDFDDTALNYASIVYPFYAAPLGRNAVFSLNYQEAYDFTQAFSADVDLSRTTRALLHDVRTVNVGAPNYNLTIVNTIDTWVETRFIQRTASAGRRQVEYAQEGAIDAVSPSFAVELRPGLYAGVTANFYQNRNRIRSAAHTRLDFDILHTRQSTASFTYEGVHRWAGILDIPVSGQGVYPPLAPSSSIVQASIEQHTANEFDDLHGWNGTLGLLWTLSRHLTLGAAVELPWTVEGEQTHRSSTHTVYRDMSGMYVLSEQNTVRQETKEIELDFPLHWAVGAVWRWNHAFYTSLDLSRALWSDFAYQAEGQPRLNPLTYAPHGERPLDDTWAVRAGAEYLVLLRATEIPLRIGAAWEERPAWPRPDDYYTFSAGSGISIGRAPGKVIVDLTYLFTWADGANGLMSEQDGLTSAVEEHQTYVSAIVHF